MVLEIGGTRASSPQQSASTARKVRDTDDASLARVHTCDSIDWSY